jgi:hypothetical protein
MIEREARNAVDDLIGPEALAQLKRPTGETGQNSRPVKLTEDIGGRPGGVADERNVVDPVAARKTVFPNGR